MEGQGDNFNNRRDQDAQKWNAKVQENNQVDKRTAFSRRTFLKGALASAVGVGLNALLRRTPDTTLASPATTSSDTPQPVTSVSAQSTNLENVQVVEQNEREVFDGHLQIGILKGNPQFKNEELKLGKRTRQEDALQNIEEMLKTGEVNVILTPEYTFQSENFSDKEYLIIERDGQTFRLGEGSTLEAVQAVQKLRQLASQYKADIFAATFIEKTIEEPIPEHQVPKSYEIVLHIGQDGQIMGVKRRLFAPEGDFTIDRDGKKYKPLLMTCGEINADGRMQIDEAKSAEIGVQSVTTWRPNWVVENGPYDMIFHPQWQGDAPGLAYLADANQGLPLPKLTWDGVTSGKKAFRNYYGDYLKNDVKPGGVVVTCDIGLAAAIRENGQPMAKYKENPAYTLIET